MAVSSARAGFNLSLENTIEAVGLASGTSILIEFRDDIRLVSGSPVPWSLEGGPTPTSAVLFSTVEIELFHTPGTPTSVTYSASPQTVFTDPAGNPILPFGPIAIPFP